MTPGLEIRPYDPGDRDAALRLVARSLGSGGVVPRTEEYWRWKHERSPFGPSVGMVAASGDELVGLRLFMRWRLEHGDEPVAAMRAVDTATHPEWRGRGIFSRLTRDLVASVADGGVDLVFNTPNRLSRPGYLKMGWQDVAQVPILVRVLRPLRMMQAFARGAGAPVAVSSRPLGLPVAELLEAPGIEALLAGSSGRDARLHTPVDLSFVAWRYAQAPGVDYRAGWRLRGTSGAAAVTRRRGRRGLDELSFSLLAVSPETEGIEAGARLIGRLVAEARPDYAVACAATGTPERRALRRAGFLPLAFPGPRFTVRPLDSSLAFASRWAAWRLSIGDLELF